VVVKVQGDDFISSKIFINLFFKILLEGGFKA
jgi:hypothetical protein